MSRYGTPLTVRSSGAPYQFAQRVKVPDDERTAPGIKNPGGAPEGELFIDRFPAGADHLSQIVLRYWDGDVALFWSAMMVHQEQQPLCNPGWEGEKSGVLNRRARPP